MAILAVCPFCQQGKVRAPDNAVGLSATCPSCHNCFTIVASKEAAANETAAKAQRSRTAVATEATLAKATLSDATPLPTGITAEAPMAFDRSAPPSQPETPSERMTVMTLRPPSAPESESIFSLAMFAFILVGAALFISQITRYGRYVTVGLAMLGVVLAFLALISAYRGRLWPSLALAANLLTILVVTALPSWLALDSWWAARPVNDKGITKSRPLDGGAAGMLAGGWIDVSQAGWQRDDILVTFSNAWIGNVQLIGAKDKRQFSKNKLLVVSLKFANVGAARRIDYRSWQRPAPPDAPVPVVTDSTGKTLAAYKIEDGWEVRDHAINGAIMPGQNHTDWLIFEAPDPKAEFVRMELPAWALGEKGDPIRLQIPRSMIGSR